MGLQERGWEPRRQRTVHSPLDASRLALASRNQDERVRPEDRCHSHRQRLVRHFLGIAVKELRVVSTGSVVKGHAMRERGELVTRLVEADVPVRPNPEQLEVDAARRFDVAFVPRALGVEIGRKPIQEMDPLRVKIDGVEQVPPHELSETAGMRRVDSNELVEVECRHAGEAHAAGRVKAPQFLIRGDRRSAGRQPEHNRRTLVDRVRHADRQGARDVLLSVEDVNAQDNRQT